MGGVRMSVYVCICSTYYVLVYYMYQCGSMGGVHMSGVTASRGEMMQVTPDAARARPKRTFYLSAAALLHKVGIYWKKTI